jgi:hypothetical protein
MAAPDARAILLSLGFVEVRADQTLKNPKLTQILLELCQEVIAYGVSARIVSANTHCQLGNDKTDAHAKHQFHTSAQADITAEKGPSEKYVTEGIFNIAAKFPPRAKPGRRSLLLKYVLDGKITTEAQLTGVARKKHDFPH